MRNLMQSLCPTCGQYRQVVSHRGGACDVVRTEVRHALKRFAEANGSRWKSKLCGHWEKACADISDINERQLLQEARNVIGPSRLYKIKLPRS